MIKTIIIDDEAKSRAALRNQIKNYCPSLELIAEADSVETGISAIRKHNPELVFLDIQLTDGTGFDILAKLNQIDFALIFATAYDQYALRAFDFSATDYLLKPIDPDQLVKAVDKARQGLQSKSMHKKLEALLENKQSLEKLALPTFDGITLIRVQNIIRCQADSNYTTFHLLEGEKVVVTKTLKDYDELLSPVGFFRIHQSHLINLKYVQKYLKGDGGSVKMEDGTILEIARRRKDTFLETLLNQ